LQPDAIARRSLKVIHRRYLYAGAGIASFFLFLMINIPAGAITGLLSDRLPENIRISGVNGTFWNGSLHSVKFNGWQLSDTQWDLNPAGLLLGRLSARVTARIAGSEFTTDATISLSGTITVRDLEAAGPLSPLATQLNLPVTGGRFLVQLSALTIKDGWPTSLIGSGRVAGVPLNIMGGTDGPMGNYEVEFDAETVPQDGRLTGVVSDDGGPIEVGGNILLMPPSNYELQLKLKALPGAPADITQAISLAGPAGPDGRRDLSLAGSL